MKFNVTAGAEERAAAQEFNMEAEANRVASAATTRAAPPVAMLTGESVSASFGGMSREMKIGAIILAAAVVVYMVRK